MRGRINSSSADCPAASLQLVDLGEPAYSEGSQKGCSPQEEACASCSFRGWCEGGFNHPYCECEPGWMGSSCSTPTTTYALGLYSYVNMALSFTLAPEALTMQFRIRTNDIQSRSLLRLTVPQEDVHFSIHVRGFVLFEEYLSFLCIISLL